MAAKKSIAAKLATKIANKAFNATTNKAINTGANKLMEMLGLANPKKLMPHELQELLESSTDVFELNSFTGRQVWNGKVVNDIVLTQLKNQLSEEHNLRLTKGDLREAVQLACHNNPVSPVCQYLYGLTWDGSDYIPALFETLKPKCDDARHEALVRRMLTSFLIGAVARAMEPGVKHDNVLVLRGAQRAGKSTTFQTLASPQWFRDADLDIESKEGLQTLQGAWLYELAELRAISKKPNDLVKAFMSRTSDVYRQPWAKHPETYPRSVVFCGSTNAERFLSDSTGSSRFWVVDVGTIDLPGLAAIRDQLWAQATALYNQGTSHWLNAEDTALSESINKRYAVEIKS